MLLVAALGDVTAGRGHAHAFDETQAAGQAQLLAGAELPADLRPSRAAFEAWGLRFGAPDPADPLFLPVTLPPGWKVERTEHALWSRLLDDRGRERATIFYKALFYERTAFMSASPEPGAEAPAAEP